MRSAAIQASSGSLSQARLEPAVAAADNKVLFAGGLFLDRGGGSSNLAPSSVVDIYDAESGSWSTGELSKGRNLLVATGVGSKAFFAGGHDGIGHSGTIDQYDGAAGTWSTTILSELRKGFVATSVGTKALFAGGCLNDSCSRLSSVVDIYDNATGTWSTASLSQDLDNLVATRIGRTLFLANGPSAVVEIYDDSAGTWSTAALSQERVGLVATSAGSKALFAGGQTGKYRADSNRVDIYDTSTGIWSTTTFSQIGGGSVAAGTIGAKAIFADGTGGVAEIYDDTTGTWSTASLSSVRVGMTMTTLGTRALLAGGHDGQVTAVVDVYDASTGDGRMEHYHVVSGSSRGSRGQHWFRRPRRRWLRRSWYQRCRGHIRHGNGCLD